MHRESGRSVDLNVRLGRAIGKMKATITQKLVIDDISIAVECDSQFIFLCLIEDGKWKVKYDRLFYEKDKVIAADGKIFRQCSPKMGWRNIQRGISI